MNVLVQRHRRLYLESNDAESSEIPVCLAPFPDTEYKF